MTKAAELIYPMDLQFLCRFAGLLELYFEGVSEAEIEGVIGPSGFGSGAFVVSLV
jgi:hypothetical protein